MKILLIYATNSGSTLEVSNHISEELTKNGNTVTLKDAGAADPDEFNDYDLIIFGAPTWGEGEVHELFQSLAERSDGKTFPQKNFAVFGLGDTSYEHFCGAADHLKEYVGTLQGKLVSEPLKINNYYFNQAEELPKITEWINKFIPSLE